MPPIPPIYKAEFVPLLSSQFNVPFHPHFLKKQDLHRPFGNKPSTHWLVPSNDEFQKALKFLQFPENIWDSVKGERLDRFKAGLETGWQRGPQSACMGRLPVQHTQSPKTSPSVPPPSLPVAWAGFWGSRRVGVRQGKLGCQAVPQWGLLDRWWETAVMWWGPKPRQDAIDNPGRGGNRRHCG